MLTPCLTCSASDRCDPEMGLLKNMVRRELLTETVENMTEVRVSNYSEVAALLRKLGAESPNNGVGVAGGIHKRIIIEVPAIGKGSPRQNIARGASAAGAVKDRQFTDQNSEEEIVRGVSHSVVRMRHRSCHFCKPCMDLDPAGRDN